MGLSLLLGRQTQLLLTTLRSSCTTEPPSLSSSSAWLLFRQGSTLEIRFSALLMGCLVEQWTSTAGFTQHSQFPGLGEKSTRSTGSVLQRGSVKINHILEWRHQMRRWSITNTTSGLSLSCSYRLPASTCPG